MTEVVDLAFAVVTSVLLSAGSSFFTFRLGVERRLVEIETLLRRDSPSTLADRLRSAEDQLETLRPLRLLLQEHGEGTARVLFQRGAGK